MADLGPHGGYLELMPLAEPGDLSLVLGRIDAAGSPYETSPRLQEGQRVGGDLPLKVPQLGPDRLGLAKSRFRPSGQDARIGARDIKEKEVDGASVLHELLLGRCFDSGV